MNTRAIKSLNAQLARIQGTINTVLGKPASKKAVKTNKVKAKANEKVLVLRFNTEYDLDTLAQEVKALISDRAKQANVQGKITTAGGKTLEATLY